MSKFKVGDFVIGNEKANRYGITIQGWIGVVKDVGKTGSYIQVGPKDNPDDADFTVDSTCFDLYKRTHASMFAEMTVEQLVDFFTSEKVSTGCAPNTKKCIADCKACWLKWLEAKE